METIEEVSEESQSEVSTEESRSNSWLYSVFSDDSDSFFDEKETENDSRKLKDNARNVGVVQWSAEYDDGVESARQRLNLNSKEDELEIAIKRRIKETESAQKSPLVLKLKQEPSLFEHSLFLVDKATQRKDPDQTHGNESMNFSENDEHGRRVLKDMDEQRVLIKTVRKDEW